MDSPKKPHECLQCKIVPVPSFVQGDGICISYTADKRRTWAEHCHDMHQIIIVTEPRSECEIAWTGCGNQRKQVSLCGQNIIYIEKSVPHAFRTGMSGVFISVGVPDEDAARLTMGNLWSGVQIRPWWKVLKYDIFIWSVVQVIRALCHAKERPHSRDLASYAHALASHLLAVERERRASVCEGLTPMQLRKLDIYIEEHFREKISLRELASVVGLKKDHFGHLFKISTGITPHYYIIACRLEYVRRLKMLGRFTNARIAAEAGFYDESHLSQTVKQFCTRGWKDYNGILSCAAGFSNKGKK